ncbi:hypothetical protein U9M48_014162 [Paspalum notatum var. saurae]|uniref:RING-type domain-containing protein n=1 Tax=Paspalum notatum var. saurae TaxID=547442 RepID=A0AAQ3T2A7_PASNO
MADGRRPDGSYGPEYGPLPPELEYAMYHQLPSRGRVHRPLHRGDYSGRLWEPGFRRRPFELSRHPLQPYAPFRIHHVHDSSGSGANLNPRQRREDPGGLTDEEFRVAMDQLRKQEYSQRGDSRGRLSRSARAEAPLATTEEEKACTICLDTFVPGEQVVVTPCDHMFHQGCITPWVKGHGNCPVCRFSLCERRNAAAAVGSDAGDEVMDLDLLAMMRAMEAAFSRARLSDFMSYYH